MRSIVVEVDLGKYKSVKLERDEALRLLEVLSRSYKGEDLKEAERCVRNFDAFYESLARRMKDYYVLPKNIGDMIKGLTLLDKVKLIKNGEARYVVLVFDRRVDQSLIEGALKEIGYDTVKYKKVGL